MIVPYIDIIIYLGSEMVEYASLGEVSVDFGMLSFTIVWLVLFMVFLEYSGSFGSINTKSLIFNKKSYTRIALISYDLKTLQMRIN